MKFAIAFVATICVALSAWAAEPDHQWVFNDGGKSDTKPRFTRQNIAQGQGVDDTDGLLCGPDLINYVARFNGLKEKQATLELKFKPTAAQDARRPATLLSYAVHSYYRRQFTLYLETDGRVTAWFEIRDDKQPKQVLQSLKLSGEPASLKVGQWHTVRVASESGGSLRIWLNGKLYASLDKAIGFADLEGLTPNEYPFLGLGYDLYASPAQTSRPFVGVIDDVKIWKSIQEPPVVDLSDAQASSESASTSLLIADGDRLEWTRPFTVYDRPTQVLGVMEPVEKKFSDAAARAAIQRKDGKLHVHIQCPIPPDTQLQLNARSPWQGDCVEFFLKTDATDETYYQYVINADGRWVGFRYRSQGNRDANWTSQSEATVNRSADRYDVLLIIPLSEVGLVSGDKPDASRFLTGNFNRSGPTAGGQSSWAAVGDSFHNTSAFGAFILGSRREALTHRLAQIDQQISSYDDSPLKQKSLLQSQQIAQAIAEQGDNPRAWDKLSAALYNHEQQLVQLALQGKPYLIQGRAAWDNNLTVSTTARPMESIKLHAARHDRLIHGFTFTNLTDNAFLGQIKFVPVLDQLHRFNRQPEHPLDGHLKLYESLPMRERNGQYMYDPLSPLPMGTVVRAAGKSTVPLWLEVDTRDLPAGQYTGWLYLKSAQQDFPDQAIPFELTVADIDLSAVKVDSFNYHYMPTEMSDVLVRYGLNMLYAGTPGQSTLDIYPQYDAQGNITSLHFEHLDEKIKAYQRAGVQASDMKIIFFLAVDAKWVTRRGKKTQFEMWSPQWETAFKNFLDAMIVHLDKQYGITQEQIVLYPVDEPSGDVDVEGTQANTAYRFARLVRGYNTRVRMMVNPNLREDELSSRAVTRLGEVFDIITIYRGHVTPKIIGWTKKTGREIWTYHILQRTNTPATYRRLAWQNLRDGIPGVIAYWHFDQMAGGDGFNPNDTFPNKTNTADYGTVYVDFNNKSLITSRRQEAWYRGFLDYKLATYCQQQLAQGKGSEADKKELARIITQGVGGEMPVMDQMREALLQLAVRLSQ